MFAGFGSVSVSENSPLNIIDVPALTLLVFNCVRGAVEN